MQTLADTLDVEIAVVVESPAGGAEPIVRASAGRLLEISGSAGAQWAETPGGRGQVAYTLRVDGPVLVDVLADERTRTVKAELSRDHERIYPAVQEFWDAAVARPGQGDSE